MSAAVSFKFSPEEAPQASLFTDIQNLNAFDDGQLTAFTEIALSFLAQKEDARDNLDEFCRTKKINARALESTVQGVLYFFSEALRRSLKEEDVKGDLERLGLQTGKAESLASTYQKQFTALSMSLIDNTFKINQVVDLEWKFGVTAGTSELAEVGACFLQVRFVTMKDGKRDSVLVEMTLPQFYNFLSSMQAAAREIDSA